MAEWLSLWSLGADLSTDHLREVRDLGFTGVEIWAEHPGAPRHLDWVRQAGLMASLHLPFHDLNLATPDEVVAQRALEINFGWIRSLAAVGGRHAVLHGGYAWASEHREESVERFRNRLKLLVEAGKTEGVDILLENLCPDKLRYTHWIASDLEEWWTLLEDTGANACLDLGHLAVMSCELPETVRRLGSKLQSIHYSDNDGRSDQHLWPGEGSGISDHFWDVMDQSGYKGVVIYEINPYVYSFETLAAKVRTGGTRQ